SVERRPSRDDRHVAHQRRRRARLYRTALPGRRHARRRCHEARQSDLEKIGIRAQAGVDCASPGMAKAPSISPERQLAAFIARYSPEIQTLFKKSRAVMRARLPG